MIIATNNSFAMLPCQSAPLLIINFRCSIQIITAGFKAGCANASVIANMLRTLLRIRF